MNNKKIVIFNNKIGEFYMLLVDENFDVEKIDREGVENDIRVELHEKDYPTLISNKYKEDEDYSDGIYGTILRLCSYEQVFSWVNMLIGDDMSKEEKNRLKKQIIETSKIELVYGEEEADGYYKEYNQKKIKITFKVDCDLSDEDSKIIREQNKESVCKVVSEMIEEIKDVRLLKDMDYCLIGEEHEIDRFERWTEWIEGIEEEIGGM